MVGRIVDAFIADDFVPPDPIETLERTLQSLLDFHTTSPELMTTIGYPALVADPASVSEASYAALGLPALRISAWDQASRSDQFGRPA